MPNYTWNTIKASSEIIEKLCKNNNFDFNTLIPMPEILKHTTSGTITDLLVALHILENNNLRAAKKLAKEYGGIMYLFVEGKSKNQLLTEIKKRLGDKRYDVFYHCADDGTPTQIVESILSGEDYYNIFKNEKYRDWYDWACDNWGTKWNAFDVSVDILNGALSFTTAWSMPEPIFEKICDMFPNEEIEFEAEYEDNLLVKAFNNKGMFFIQEEFEGEYSEDGELLRWIGSNGTVIEID